MQKRLLALETSDVSGSVALYCGDERIDLRALPNDQRSAQSLAPTMRAVLNDVGWRASELDVVAVTIGPGSFTGLRVGVATAKAFAWAINASTVGVDTLDAIAFEICARAPFPDAAATATKVVLSVGVDAQRGDSAVRDYLLARDASGRFARPERVEERYRVVANKEWLSRASMESEVPTLFAGPGLRRVRNLASLASADQLIDSEYWSPSADGVALVAIPRIESGTFDDVWRLAPDYSRLAAAEEKALAKEEALRAKVDS